MSEGGPPDRVDVLIIGGGPAGLAAAVRSRELGAGRVLVVERERAAGGVPARVHHPGFGIRDLHRPLPGPRYAQRYVDRALAAGAEIRTETSVTGWTGERAVSVTSPAGVRHVEARAVILATGCRERPRTARLIPGDRPQGVLTTGSLQRLLAAGGHRVGNRAVVVGGEHVAFSAVWALHRAGVKVVALVTEHPSHESFAILGIAASVVGRIPILTGRRVTRVIGRRRLEGLEISGVDDGSLTRIGCDTVVFTGAWVPEAELAALGGLGMNAGTMGPSIDPAFRSTRPGVFAAGNVLRGAETADVAAIEGTRVARSVVGWLESGAWVTDPVVAVEAVDPVAWATPDVIPVGTPRIAPDARLTLRVGRFVSGRVVVEQDGEPLWTSRWRRRLMPGRLLHTPLDWIGRVRPDGGAVRVRLESGP